MSERRGAADPALPLTSDECRARFRRAAADAGLPARQRTISARGPEGQRLSVDWVRWGPPEPRHLLMVLSGVHGVEGFLGSAVQCDLIGRQERLPAAADVGVLIVHAVNPWGMAWSRRVNESNVDLNRNWRRDDSEPPANPAYEELHPLACPDTPGLPPVDELAGRAAELLEHHGYPWLRDGLTGGQYTHPDGLHYGGARTEESNRILESILGGFGRVERAFVLDLHTGHGPTGGVTLLSDRSIGSDQDRTLRSLSEEWTVESTADGRTGSTGRIANGIRDSFGAGSVSTSAEFGTVDDLEQLAATYQEHWVHRHGDLNDDDHAAVVRRYRACFTPDDPTWAGACRRQGARVLDRALDTVIGWGTTASGSASG